MPACSTTNLHSLDDADLRFIVGSRTVKAPGDLANHFHWNGDAFTDGKVVDTITPRATTSKKAPTARASRKEPVWDPQEHPGHWRAVWSYSRKQAVDDGHILTAQENRARAIIAGEKPVKSTRFVTTIATGRSQNEDALARARELVGLKGYVINIPSSAMDPAEVLSSYHDLWHVEQSFRISKTDLQARPMFHDARDAIEAHLTIVFTAFAIARYLQHQTGLSIRMIIRTLRPLQEVVIRLSGQQITAQPELTDDPRTILDASTH